MLLSVSCFLQSGCSYTDSNYIPLGITGYSVYLYDANKAPNADYFVGTIETNYLKREQGLEAARALAYNQARQLGFDTYQSRYYIICTRTNDSSCATKIR